MSHLMAAAAVRFIIVHCSDSEWGDEPEISKWHKDRNFDFAPKPGLDGEGTFTGYHHVILNGFATYRQLKDGVRAENDDGRIEPGRSEKFWGCHALGYNDRSVGICLIGVRSFTPKQYAAAVGLVNALRAGYMIPVENVLGHCETALSGGKTCPNFDMKAFRLSLTP